MNRREVIAGCGSAPLLWRAGATAHAQQATTVEDDIAILRAAMAIHPGVHRYLSPREADRNLVTFEDEYRKAAGQGSLGDQYLALSRFLATLRCGHSYANFFNQNAPAAQALFDSRTRLPFHFEWLGDAMIVTSDHSGTNAVPRGTRIETINGVEARRILATLLAYTRADGHNDAKRRSLLSVRGAERIEYFDVFQGLIFPAEGAVHHLQITLPDGRHTLVEVSAIGLSDRQATMTRVPEDSAEPRWRYVVRPDGIAVLDMPGWAMWNSKWDWRSWLAEQLDATAETRGLIIDLRANEGGDDCGNPILARLIDRDLPAWPYEARVRFRELSAQLAPYVSTWGEKFKRLGVDAAALGGGWYSLADRDRPEPVKPDPKGLTCPVAVLTGPANSSATFAFINAARATGRVRSFGQTTGGNRRGINGGAFFFTTLPHSQIEFDLPLIGYFPTAPQPDAGIAPDEPIAVRQRDIIGGTDPVMAAAARWALAQGKG